MDPARYVVELDNAICLMSQAVCEADPNAPVPTCPGWTVTDLIDHLGCVHLWAAQAARSTAKPDPFPTRDQGGRTLAQWYADCGRELVETLSGLDADEPCFTFSKTDRTVGFWNRRQLHETTIHWVDTLLANGQGLPGSPELTSEVAEDGVDEVLTFFLPRQIALGRVPLAAVVPDRIAVHGTEDSTEGGTEWIAEPRPGEVWVTRGPSETVAARIRGSYPELYLVLWKRGDASLLRVDGQVPVASAFLSGAVAP